ncbi:MAG: acyl-CoA dehydratase activase [Myxococcota bacterium]
MRYLGIDIGMMFVKVCIINKKGDIERKWYIRHYFEPIKALANIIEEVRSFEPESFNITGSASEILKRISNDIRPLDIIGSNIAFATHISGGIRHIIDIGAGSLSYVRLNERGEIENIATNSLCAAGTGSFVDEQLSRLGLNYDMVRQFKRIEDPPSIATRCAVFAKSDITHRQQEGYSKEESYSGLCKGLATTIFQTLIRGKMIEDDILILGGLTLNNEVMYWLKKVLGERVFIPDNSEVSGAAGAAILTLKDGGYPFDSIYAILNSTGAIRKGERLRPPLRLNLSQFPEDLSLTSYVDVDGTEVRLYEDISNKKVSVFLGMDIGSTSTKCAIVDKQNKIVADFYRKTSGEPILSAKKLFVAMLSLKKRYNAEIEILGFATTGSGRRLIGELFGADLIINEITAHAEGAVSLFPDVKTIFEIGGQDSKYIRIEDKKVVDSNMNYVCAAGTGSFIEEQAKRLGFDINEVGNKVEGILPPYTSDRCTVFMEQDINRLLKEGYSREEVLAAVHYSIIQNYLTKVVGNRRIDRENIVFMGATARNKGLVAAIENLLNVRVNVSPYCYINGAYGAAVILKQRHNYSNFKSRFRGFELLDSDINVSKRECRLCSNRCQIFTAIGQNGKSISSWGYMCGREEDESVSRHSPNYEPYNVREKIIRDSLLPVNKDYRFTVGIPRALSTYSYLPFFYNLLALLGMRPVISRRTDGGILSLGSYVLTSDFCYPVKVAHGHIRYLVDVARTDFILVPDMISEERNNVTTNSLFCPYLSSLGSMVKSIFAMRGEDEKRLISFPLDMRMREEKILNLIYEELKSKDIKITYLKLKDAFEKAMQIQRDTERALEEKGKEIISSLKEDERAIVVIGRPYNSIDGDVNLSIPAKIAQLGFKVIPIDMVPFDINLLKGRFENIYWEYGQRIISALINVARNKRLNAVYISNFKCGPDSFLLSIAEDIMASKPMLILEIDEHGADAGYQTRIEAFAEVLKSESGEPVSLNTARNTTKPLSERIVLIPPMHEITSRLFAASFRCEGYRSLPLPETTYESFNIGKMYTRGSECLPMIVTLGSLLDFINRSGYLPSELAYFMPTATGPCRFGQYAILSEIALKKAGIEDIIIISPAAYNTYRGLSVSLRMRLWYSVIIGDLLYKMAMKIRPYETIKGTTDKVLSRYIKTFERGIERDMNLFEIMREAVEDFSKISIDKSRNLPIVGVMGEIYVRSEPFSNQKLIRYVEEAGAEVWLTPLSEWFHYVSEMRLFFQQEGLREKDPLSITKAILFKQFFRMTEREFFNITLPILANRVEPDVSETIELGSRYVSKLFEGETIITIGRAIEFIKSGVSLIINVSPFNCMPGTISSGVFERIQKEYNACILNLFYDGEGDINHIIKTAIYNISKQKRGRVPDLYRKNYYVNRLTE